MSNPKDPMSDFISAAQKGVDEFNEAKSPAQVAEESIAAQAEEGKKEEIVKEEVIKEEVIEEPKIEETAEELKLKEEVIDKEIEKPLGELEIDKDKEPPKDEALEEVINKDNVIEDWDDPDAATDDKDKTSFDYKSFAQEVGFEASSKEEFITKVNEYKVKAEVPNPIDKLPDNLKKAVEIANQDGDFMQYLGVTSVDYDAVSDTALVQNNYASILAQRDGKVDQDMLEGWMDELTDSQVAQKGAELRQQLKGQQDQVKVNIEADTTRNRENADKELRSVLDNLQEHRGFKYSPTNKKQLYDGISSGNMIAEMFNSDGKLDMKKVVSAYSDYKFGDKQNKFLRQRTQVETKKEMLNKLSNKSIEPKAAGLPTPKEKEKELDAQGKVAKMAREKDADGKSVNPFAPVN